MFIVILIVQNV